MLSFTNIIKLWKIGKHLYIAQLFNKSLESNWSFGVRHLEHLELRRSTRLSSAARVSLDSAETGNLYSTGHGSSLHECVLGVPDADECACACTEDKGVDDRPVNTGVVAEDDGLQADEGLDVTPAADSEAADAFVWTEENGVDEVGLVAEDEGGAQTDEGLDATVAAADSELAKVFVTTSKKSELNRNTYVSNANNKLTTIENRIIKKWRNWSWTNQFRLLQASLQVTVDDQ